MNIDEIRSEFYWLISQRDICSQIISTGRMVLDYDSDKVNKRIKELGHILYEATNGEEGSKND